MQGYKEITLTDVARDAVMQLQENIKTIASNNAGTAFPTENLYDGMLCYRTDKATYYSYNSSTETWGTLNSLPVASTSILGGIKVGSGLSITSAGVLSATATAYTLPTASASTLGGIKVGSGLSITSGILKVTSAPTATTATSATKATQDGNGNIITKTYAPIESPTFEGTVTVGALTVVDALKIPGGKVWIE